MVKIAIYCKVKNKVIDVIHDIDLLNSQYYNREDEYEYVDIPSDLIDYPIKIIKTDNDYMISIDENILHNILPDILKNLRQIRNKMIRETDYLVLNDVINHKIKIIEYTQYLRDFPNNITIEDVKKKFDINILSYDEYIDSRTELIENGSG